MYGIFSIAKNNIKKKKSDAVVLLILVSMASLFLYISISTLSNTLKVVDKASEKSNTADFFFMTDSKDKEKIENIIKGQEEVRDFEVTNCMDLPSVKYHSESDTSEKAMSFILEDIEEDRSICKMVGIIEGKKQYNSIVLPYYIKASENYDIGSKVYLHIGKNDYEFVIYGFAEEPLFGTPINIDTYKAYITSDYMNDIYEKEDKERKQQCQQYKVKLKENVSSYEFYEKILTIFNEEIPDIEKMLNFGLTWEGMRDGTVLLSNLTMTIILVFSAFIMLIALVVMRFSIQNFIEENMKNIGVLQSAGYTTKQLRSAALLQNMSIAFFGIIIGISSGGFLSPVIGSVQSFMVGLRWNLGFDVLSALITVSVVSMIIFAVTYFTTRIYKKITVLNALRGGIHNHNFRKNYFSMEKYKLPQSIILGFKSMFGDKIKNLGILIIIMFLSLIMSTGFSLYQNFALDKTNLLKLSGIEVGTAIVIGDNLESVGDKIKSWNQVDYILKSNSCKIKVISAKKSISLSCDIWDKPEKLINELLIEGRLPKYDNEIVLTAKTLKILDAKLGDVVYIQGSGEKKEYIICGVDQKINNMGTKALMTMEASERLNGQDEISKLIICNKDGFSYKELENKILTEFKNINVLDSHERVENITEGVAMGMKLICVVFVLITIFVVSMVVMLLIKTKVARERKNYGVYKALGFTTWQLICQTIMSNFPIIFLGSILGMIVSVFTIDSMVVTFLSISGIKSCSMVINPIWLIITVLIITSVAIVVALISSSKIRHIEPVKMLMEE